MCHLSLYSLCWFVLPENLDGNWFTQDSLLSVFLCGGHGGREKYFKLLHGVHGNQMLGVCWQVCAICCLGKLHGRWCDYLSYEGPWAHPHVVKWLKMSWCYSRMSRGITYAVCDCYAWLYSLTAIEHTICTGMTGRHNNNKYESFSCMSRIWLSSHLKRKAYPA